MELMNLRRGLMAQMAQSGNWKKIVITNPTRFTLGGALYDLVAQAIPNAVIAVGVLDADITDISQLESGTMYEFLWTQNQTQSQFHRVYQNSYQVDTPQPMNDTYLCVVAEGAKFVVLYQE